VYICIYKFICISDTHIYLYLCVLCICIFDTSIFRVCVYTYLCIHAYTNAQRCIDMHAYTCIHVTYACAIEYIHDVSKLVQYRDIFTYLHMFACASLEVFMYMCTSVFRRMYWLHAQGHSKTGHVAQIMRKKMWVMYTCLSRCEHVTHTNVPRPTY